MINHGIEFVFESYNFNNCWFAYFVVPEFFEVPHWGLLSNYRNFGFYFLIKKNVGGVIDETS